MVWSRQGLRRMNADHSLGGLLDERAGRGEISRADARANPHRHVLRAAVTGERMALIDQDQAVLAPGDLVLVATDGVLTLPDERLGELLAEARAPSAAVSAVLDAITQDMPEDQDTATVAVIRIPGERAPDGRGRRLARALALLLVFALAIAALGVLSCALGRHPGGRSDQGAAMTGERSSGSMVINR
jgi:hypothetical protein